MTILDALAVFGRLHPLLLHLPIGLVAGVALLEAVALVRPRLALRPAVSILLWCAALVAAISAGTGWILAGEASYGGDTLELHRWLGLSLAGVVFVTAIVQSRAKPPAFYRVGLVLALALLIPAGHFGGELTRGPGFVLEPLASKRPRTPTAMVAMDIQRTVFEATIRPTLDATCVACHNEQKRKAGLSLVDGESIMAGSENGEVVVAGDVANSELVRRLRLPLDDDDHMPPEGKRQPSEAEIAAIETWILVRRRVRVRWMSRRSCPNLEKRRRAHPRSLPRNLPLAPTIFSRCKLHLCMSNSWHRDRAIFSSTLPDPRIRSSPTTPSLPASCSPWFS